MIRLESKGDYKKAKEWVAGIKNRKMFKNLDRFGERGVAALSSATPRDTGLTADSWQYRVIRDGERPGIEWYNTNVAANGTPVAILIQYGHGTRNGGYIQGRDFINPAIAPIFAEIIQDYWKEVTS